MLMRRFALILFLAGAALQGGCATFSKLKPKPAPAPPVEPAKPKHKSDAERASEAAAGLVAAGSPHITIDLSDQRAYFYKGEELAATSRVSTGKPGFRTPSGSFHVTQKERVHHSTVYGKYVDASGDVVNGDVDVRKEPKPEGASYVGASMPYFLRFNGAVGMHAGHVPASAASHGCVRLPRSMAPLFFEHAPVGTPVLVRE